MAVCEQMPAAHRTHEALQVAQKHQADAEQRHDADQSKGEVGEQPLLLCLCRTQSGGLEQPAAVEVDHREGAQGGQDAEPAQGRDGAQCDAGVVNDVARRRGSVGTACHVASGIDGREWPSIY